MEKPTEDEIESLRLKYDLTPTEAGELVEVGRTAWVKWENGTNTMQAGLWKLFQIMVGEIKVKKLR